VAIGDLIKLIASLRFDSSAARHPTILHISGNVYAIAYQGPGTDGWLKTVSISDDGVTLSIISSFEFDTSSGQRPDMIHVSGDVYAIAYRGAWDHPGYLKTVGIQSNGTITGTIDSFTFEDSMGQCEYPTIAYVTGDVYAIAYLGPDSDGWLKTVGIQSNGTITGTIDSFEFDNRNCTHPDIICRSLGTFAIAYCGLSYHGWLKTVRIQDDGTITGTIDSLEFDTGFSIRHHIIHTSGNVHAIAYEGPGSDGWLKTVGIQSNGTITGTIDSLEFDTALCTNPDIIHVVDGVYSIAYQGPGDDGWLKTVGIQSNGTITGTIGSFEFDTGDGRGPGTIHIANDVCAIAYGNSGWLKTVQITEALAAAHQRFTGGLLHRSVH